MTTSEVEYISGQESHTSNWGKFYVKGLEKVVVKEDHSRNQHDKHHSYQCYVGMAVPDGCVFTIFYQDGDKRGTESWYYMICVTDSGAAEQTIEYGYTGTFIRGCFRVVAQAKTLTKAPRLMDWWDKRGAADPLAYAQHCAAYIDKRGVAVLPPMPPMA